MTLYMSIKTRQYIEVYEVLDEELTKTYEINEYYNSQCCLLSMRINTQYGKHNPSQVGSREGFSVRPDYCKLWQSNNL